MTLKEKLEKINEPKVAKLPDGNARTIGEFWETFVETYLPEKEVVLKWHEVLKEYVSRPDAVFAIRGYNTAAKAKYDTLRRGFLTQTDEGYLFFYTDNFHAAYYLKMAMDGYVPDVDELLHTYQKREFPARFGRDTSEERALMAIKGGKDPGIQTAGYKIAHIINVGTDYCINGKNTTLSGIVNVYFPRGERSDWTERTDATGKYFIRDFAVAPEARQYLVAEFLRFVHPFNYFLTPKPSCAVSGVSKDIAEYLQMVEYARKKFAEIYGDAYEEFLDMILLDRSPLGDVVIDLEYSLKIKDGKKAATAKKKAEQKEQKKPEKSVEKKKKKAEQQKKIEEKSPEKRTEKVERKNQTPQQDRKSEKMVKSEPVDLSGNDLELQIIKEYLMNPKTSFRKLERQFMSIDSKTNGGGFIAKGIVNAYGITAERKGILSSVSIDQAIADADGAYKETLQKVKKVFDL